MNNNLNDIWQKTLKLIKDEVTELSYKTWIEPISLSSIQNNCITLLVTDEFVKNTLEKRYLSLLKNSILQVIGSSNKDSFQIVLLLENTMNKLNQSENANSDVIIGQDTNASFLNPKYTFDTFVIGNSNRLAHAASVAVAESPAKAYNPLFLYGGVGLGKTHLMHAIGHHVLEENNYSNIVYVTSEQFTNELINSIKNNRNEEFRNKYRNVDVLMVDDIQFIAGKESTQEEFFHTFNALHQANKQIIISSDRPPKEIPTLEDRLRSRFEWGLLADIAPPDLETRVAILRKKADVEKVFIPDETMYFIAKRIQSNIRELEGALIKTVAYASLTGREIDEVLATEALKDILNGSRPKTITIEYIKHVVSEYFGLRPEDFSAKKRTKTIVYPRQIAMYLCRELTDMSLPKIGESFGRDHTTIMHACDKIKTDVESDYTLKSQINAIKKILEDK